MHCPRISCGKQNQYYGFPSGKSFFTHTSHRSENDRFKNCSDDFCLFFSAALDLSSRCVLIPLFLDQHRPESDSNLTADGDCRPFGCYSIFAIVSNIFYRTPFITEI
ncbi:hypothetical protein CEXT_493731 [Caerostris extrusa]|uniref:Uncharacterized protein n=1 Tax=Caerostris extrusa TaxID=172846 RepID=A0AAV4T4W4_CAEEX|nr:hypothetical protein CEXT_493731 [Caerostris extrusa]